MCQWTERDRQAVAALVARRRDSEAGVETVTRTARITINSGRSQSALFGTSHSLERKVG